ncbi:MAG: LamG-like jellyroll fold domain-containing protein, partial [Thermoplasmatota archaeon]
IVTDYAVIPHHPNLNFDNDQNMYMEAWFQTENLENKGRQTILSKFESSGSNSNGYILEIDQQKISLRLFNGLSIGRAWGNYQIQNAYWYHVWATYDYGSNWIKIELNIIQNGVETHAESVATQYSSGIGTTTCDLYFGTWYNGLNGNFHSPIYNGYLDGIIFATGSSF